MIQGHGDDTYQYTDIRINFSSNIYTHADLSALKRHLQNHLDVISSYPEPQPFTLERILAHHLQISPENILVTAGATEGIYLIAHAYSKIGKCYVFQPTFSEYADACKQYDYQFAGDIAQIRQGLIWLCNPNNPTGRVLDKDAVFRLAEQYPQAIIIIDQSYEDYTLAELPQAKEIITKNNIIQLHSMTKTYAIPGLRLGYIIAPAHIICVLRIFCRPWSVNALAVKAAEFLLNTHAELLPPINQYLTETQYLYHSLNALPHIKAEPTDTTFMLCKIDNHSAAQLKEYLAKQRGILIRDASNFPTLDKHYFRIATQTREENNSLITAIRQFLNE